MNITASLIIKRGETTPLIKCLQSIRPYVSEIIGAVDPRGRDDTDDVLASFGADQVDFVWTGDYAEARNASLKDATGDYILVIDTDEYITGFNFPENSSEEVYRITRENDYTDADITLQNKERLNRLFRNGLFHYEGRVHEQLVANDGHEYHTSDADIIMHHTGYTDKASMIAKSKDRRNDLMIMLAGRPDDPYVLFQIGRTYYVAEDYRNATLYFERALSLKPDTRLEYVEQLVETCGYALINNKDYKKALSLFAYSDVYSQKADFLFLCGLIYMDNAKFDEAIKEFEKATAIPECSVEGVNSYLAWYNCGVIKECMGFKKDAAAFYRKCGNYSPALEGIKRCC